jgi:hypothetical protein
MRRGEALLWTIVGAFVGYELVAHFTRYRYGRTFSEIIREGEHVRLLWLAVLIRVLVAAAVVYLGLHLEDVAP